MKKILIALLILSYWLIGPDTYATDRLGILVSKKCVLTFDSDIVDVDIDVDDYFFKLKGKNLLIRAKTQQARAATLFARYGKEKTTYVAEIFPDDKAPLHRIIQPQDTIESHREYSKKANDNELISTTGVFAPNEKQQYAWFAVEAGGVTVMVTNIAHKGKNTYLRIYINNKTTVNLKLSQHNFEYVTVLRKFLFFKSEQRNRVMPLLTPVSIELGPMQFDYFDFSIPTYTSNGGLDIFLGESENGIRKYTINIPTKILLQAPRK
jgi:hypothetical protein